MALHGHPEPNFDNIKVGATREEVEFEMGTPASVQDLSDGKREATYKYEMSNSSNPGRATVYGYIDFATFGIAEPVLTLIELFQGHDEETKVVYGVDDRALEVTGYRPPPPSLALQSAQESQRKFMRPTPTSGSLGNETTSTSATRQSIDVQLRQLAHNLSANMGNQGVTRVAVLPVQDTSGKENIPLGNYLTEKLTAKLHDEGSAKVVERSQLAKVTQELALSHGGGFDETSAMRIGSFLGVDAVITSFYADLGLPSIEINSKAIRVETGEIIGVGTAEIPRAAVERMLHY